ncbi:hypothetical protein [Rhodoferax sp.]|uniref:hypothetical protein n=1 Tax=Rhodoferax sp. TaxID=50421 RepID=UPI00262E9F29|nr:hypothetical protein [Rhodoferax sp.]MDD2924095.1 hypothetical protein [Rhodoferax sp.]
MSIPSSTLTAIQQVGAAAFAADANLKEVVKDYAERARTAIMQNPYDLGNDTLIENWKTAARLSQTLSLIEEDLRKVYQVASELNDDHQLAVSDVLVLTAPASVKAKPHKKTAKTTPAAARKKPKAAARPQATSQTSQPISDAVITAKKASAPAKKSRSAVKSPGAATPGQVLPLSGNAAKLLQHLESVLNAQTFTEINQTAVSQATGIPMGSMTAALKKLVQTGHLKTGTNGSLKLAKPAAAMADAQAPSAA